MILSAVESPTPVGERFALFRSSAPLQTATFADDVRMGLGRSPKRLTPKYFYDALGSALFEAICELPEYYLTRAELEILENKANEIVAAVDGSFEMVELGGGSGRKTRLLIEAALRRQPSLDYHPIDISPSALVGASNALLAEYDRLRISAYASDYFDVLASKRLRATQRVLTLFLGSNIGNWDPPLARRLLRTVASAFPAGNALLLGTDLKKDPATLERAYADPTGVTAAFNKNLLGRINRELHGHFDLHAFEHVSRYDGERGVVESFLVSKREQHIAIDALDLVVEFARGESIHTESSYKFSVEDIAALATATGFRVARRWTDSRERFAVSLLVAA